MPNKNAYKEVPEVLLLCVFLSERRGIVCVLDAVVNMSTQIEMMIIFWFVIIVAILGLMNMPSDGTKTKKSLRARHISKDSLSS
jgi:hypothetical protein